MQGCSSDSNKLCVTSRSLGRLITISTRNRMFHGANLASIQIQHYLLVATNNTVEWYGIGTCGAIGISMNTIANRQLSVSRTLEIDFRHRRKTQRICGEDFLIGYDVVYYHYEVKKQLRNRANFDTRSGKPFEKERIPIQDFGNDVVLNSNV
eukprot:scaffold22200_cov31-Attheya_sp.AAC.4